jgi:hypothetical protein
MYGQLKTVARNDMELDRYAMHSQLMSRPFKCITLRRLHSAYRALRAWRDRADALQGERGGIAQLTLPALRKLIMLQQVY